MISAPNETPATRCDYCGRENPDRLPACAGCGTPLVSAPPPSDSEPKRKSKGMAVFLCLIFGPLGLLYVGAWGAAFIMMCVGAPFILTHNGGLWLTIGGRLVCAAWAYKEVVDQDEEPNSRRDSSRLLDEAARLENVDRTQAIAAYEQIVQSYPNTPASREATRNIQTLSRQP